ncbi:7-carboxy-7-deazaguanine synthase QueE [Desulfovirgula thermocuniculi]|uniref:7-carboxy-7-deazaguanine synthase QueE n=1 Tax=Desulfovirgula thermocuniculi TaxID=348842 RepID=UPI00040D0CE7|nr:7-carboxy-7-deazaguanine synthase QueE [Desulfovirgula thermocuniculi]
MSLPAAPLVEIFSSLQGEGIFVGCRQIFLRLAGCNLQCSYCDTFHDIPQYCRCQADPVRGDFRLIPNPLTVQEVVKRVKALSPHLHHSLSLTGGEPLLHATFLAELLPRLPKTREGIYLETNGTLPEQLEPLLPYVDTIAMDIKLPSTAGIRPAWEEHRRFLQLASCRRVFVKLIVDHESREEEIEEALRIIRSAGDIPLVLQPVTAGGKLRAGPAKLFAWQARALEVLSDVRVIPQVHKWLGCP